MTTVRAKSTPASTAGSFAEHQHSEPENTITPKQLGIIGLGPASHNVYADRVDTAEGYRPLRPYLPLQPADDDEFFDAPIGSVLTVRVDDEPSHFQKFTSDEWRQLNEHNVPSVLPTEPGEVWASLFDDEGKMHSSVLTPPPGVLYSDQTYYVRRDAVETPIELADAVSRFPGAWAKTISRHVYGDDPGGKTGVSWAAFDEDVTVAFQGDKIYVGGASSGQGFPVATSTAFERDGDIVLRHELDFGYGWELTLRPTS